MQPGAAAHAGGAAAVPPVERALERARHVLPDQGPIGVFVHHNTLHAFQHLPFHDAVPTGAAMLGARPYLPLDEFERLYRAGRISDTDLGQALARALGDAGGESLALGLTRTALWRALMLDGIDEDDAGGVGYLRDAAEPPDPLQLAAEARLARTPRPATAPAPPRRHHVS